MNIVLVGECGTGKSSLINLIVGRHVAKTSNDTTACTTEVRSYKTSINGCSLKLWDTPGFDEGSTTRASARSSETLAKSLHQLKSKENIHLLVYCMHGNRAKTALLKHYETVRASLPTVPIVAVVTRLERYQDRMEDWWANNARELASYGMMFVDHACITAIPDCDGLHGVFHDRRVYSQRAVRDLVRRNCLPQSSSVKFPAMSVLNPAIRGQKTPKDSEIADSRTTSMQISSFGARATIRLRTAPALLLA